MPVPLCHGKKQSHMGEEMSRKKGQWSKQGEREGMSCRQLTSSDQNSEVDQVDMKLASNKSPLPPRSFYASISLPVGLLSSFPVAHASIFFSHLCQPRPQLSISLEATGSSLLHCLLLRPLPPILLLLASITHPLRAPSGPLLLLSRN